MKLVKIVILLAATIALLEMPFMAQESRRQQPREFQARARGTQEVPYNVSEAKGELQLRINEDGTSIHYVLTYSGFEVPVTVAHIHIGQEKVNGGVSVFFCGGGTRPAPCPAAEARLEGDFTAADVVGPTSQNVPAMDLPGLIKAIRAGQTYVNIHSMTSPAGEIRGQIKRRERGRDDDDR